MSCVGFPSRVVQTSPGKSESLSFHAAAAYTLQGSGSKAGICFFPAFWTLLYAASSSALHCLMRFLCANIVGEVRPELCLPLPSDSTSRWTPLRLANTSYCQACSGLSPPSYYSCWAHRARPPKGGLRFCKRRGFRRCNVLRQSVERPLTGRVYRLPSSQGSALPGAFIGCPLPLRLKFGIVLNHKSSAIRMYLCQNKV